MSEHKVNKLAKKLKPQNLSIPEKISLSYIKNDAELKVELTAEEEFVDEVCRKIFGLMMRSRPKNYIVNFLLKEYPDKIKNRMHAYRYIDDAEYIYGKGNILTKEVVNALLVAKLTRIGEKAEKSDDLKTAAYCAVKISEAQKEMTPIEHTSLMPAVIFTPNPQLLKPKELNIDEAEELSQDAD